MISYCVFSNNETYSLIYFLKLGHGSITGALSFRVINRRRRNENSTIRFGRVRERSGGVAARAPEIGRLVARPNLVARTGTRLLGFRMCGQSHHPYR